MFGSSTFRKAPVSQSLVAAIGDRYSIDELRAMDRLSTTITIPAGESFVTEGASGREVVVIVEGTAAVYRGDEEIAMVRQGDIVGERAVLLGEPRNASLIATTDLSAMVFSAREFRDLLVAHPRLDKRVRAFVAEREAD